MLTNREWLAIDQTGAHPRRVLNQDTTIVWLSDASLPGAVGGSYLAVFNTGDARQDVRLAWSALSLSSGRHHVRDLWADKDLDPAQELQVMLPPHGAALYLVQ